jgi:hypothetical protein
MFQSRLQDACRAGADGSVVKRSGPISSLPSARDAAIAAPWIAAPWHKPIDRAAVLAELQVDHEDRLYPTPDAFRRWRRS